MYEYIPEIMTFKECHDDTSILGDPDKGWGWLVERGFNAIQTDWTLALNLYLHEKGYNL